jgi:hypothetical protein
MLVGAWKPVRKKKGVASLPLNDVSRFFLKIRTTVELKIKYFYSYTHVYVCYISLFLSLTLSHTHVCMFMKFSSL